MTCQVRLKLPGPLPVYSLDFRSAVTLVRESQESARRWQPLLLCAPGLRVGGMADADAVDIEDAEEPPPELTPEEKIMLLKEALANGEMGPAVFDQNFQSVWMKIKAEEETSTSDESRRHGSRRNMVARTDDE